MPKSITVTFTTGQPKAVLVDDPADYLTPRDVALAARVVAMEYRKHNIVRRRSKEFPSQKANPVPVVPVVVGTKAVLKK